MAKLSMKRFAVKQWNDSVGMALLFARICGRTKPHKLKDSKPTVAGKRHAVKILLLPFELFLKILRF